VDVQEPHSSGRRPRLRYIVPALLAVPVVAIIALFAVAASSNATITAKGQSLATLTMPFGGGTVTRISAVGGREQKAIPVTVTGDSVAPAGKLPQGDKVTVEATIKRPGWISWLTGSTKTVKVSTTTPTAALAASFVTRHKNQPLKIDFSTPVVAVGTRPLGGTALTDQPLTGTGSEVTLHESASAGTIQVSGLPRTWEQPKIQTVSWFPAGSHATAVASPSPGTQIKPNTKITLTFSKPVSTALNGALPPVSPAGSGTWRHLNTHTIEFVPSGYGYGLGANVSVRLPAGINLVGGKPDGTDPIGEWSVPGGSTESLQELLADLGYLPVTYTAGAGEGTLTGESTAAIEAQVVKTPTGSFGWRYPNTPSQLQTLWSPTKYSELTKGAVMSFEYNNGLSVDGVAGPDVWKALISAISKKQVSTFGYTFVYVHEAASNESEVTWHNGKNVVTGAANTGIAAAPTATGTFAVFEHLQTTTMSGLNPNGTPYHDPGVKWVSYFNGGDALHEFPRASYGFPQSLGCVEMPMSEAAAVWPYTPIGTIVQVAT